MFIVSQEKDDLINVRKIHSVTVEGKEIIVGNPRDFMVTVGEYETEERAKEVFSEMLDALFPPACIVLKNANVPDGFEDEAKRWNVPVMLTTTQDKMPDMQVIDHAVYYMPEK